MICVLFVVVLILLICAFTITVIQLKNEEIRNSFFILLFFRNKNDLHSLALIGIHINLPILVFINSLRFDFYFQIAIAAKCSVMLHYFYKTIHCSVFQFGLYSKYFPIKLS